MSKKGDWFVIKDLDSFIDHSRKLIFNAYGKAEVEKNGDPSDEAIDDMITVTASDSEELEQLLPFGEASVIVKQMVRTQYHRKTKEKRYIVDDALYMEILQSLGDRITSNILAGLVNRGVVDTAYDIEKDDFVFWIPNDEK